MLKLFVYLLNIAVVTHCLNELEFNSFKVRSYIPGTGQTPRVEISGQASLTLSIKSNGIPDHKTGKVTSNLKAKDYNFAIPNLSDNTRTEQNSTCLPSGQIGVAVNGVPIYNSYTPHCCDSGNSPLSAYDECWGQVDSDGVYFYSVPPLCLVKPVCGNSSGIIGVAMDGFPIYGPYDEMGNVLTSKDLDQCNGMLDRYQKYRYHVTFDFPYTLGCFMGLPPPGYSPTVCGCNSLVTPCESSTPPILPDLPGARRKRSTSSTTQANTHLKSIKHPKCCSSSTNCTYEYNPGASSNSNVVRGGMVVIVPFLIQALFFLIL